VANTTLRVAKAAPLWRDFSLPSATSAVALAVSLSLILSACGNSAAPAQSDLVEAPGTVELNQTPPTDVPLGGGGSGTVFFHGKVYAFAIGGLGIDGSAVAIIRTTGEVYRLEDIAGFSGTYRRAPGAAVVPGQPSGGVWLQNERATILHLQDPPGGRMPNIGGDAVRVVLN
jgi:hypothetical protein